MNTDPIADLLTRIRNAASAGHKFVELPASKLKIELARVLLQEGYIKSYELKDDPQGRFKILRVVLKYDKAGYPVIRRLARVSRPGLRKYAKVDTMPRVLNGAGVAIISTSKGILTDRAARREKVGGEILCVVE
jgi:small subunit ribosomal protein S8